MQCAAVVLSLILFAVACDAEPRWCSITGRGPNDKFFYPPIAKAARVSGVVVGRVVYEPSGKVVRFEPVFGPLMLSGTLSGQLEKWTIKTDAFGDELCATLVIAEFRLLGSEESARPVEIRSEPGSVLRVSAESEIVCLCDPGGVIGYGNPLRHAWYAIRRTAIRVFGKHRKPSE